MSGLKIIPNSFIFILIFISCTSSQDQSNKLAEQIRIVDIESWLNMMPGGPGSFHVIGKYECSDTADCSAQLKNIKVYSDSVLIYDLTKENFRIEKQIEQDTQRISYSFYTQPGIKLNDRIQSIEKVDVTLIFIFNDVKIEKKINDIVLTRAY
jgi:hypothetical protein